jgi:hypothetical protein
MSTGATLTVLVINQRIGDTQAQSLMQAVSLDHDLEGIGFVLPLTSDLTTIPSAGTIQRVIVADFSTMFMQMYPTDPNRLAALNGVLSRLVEAKVPCVVNSHSEVLF